MLRSLYSGVSGVKGQQAHLDVISNNIANVSTTGYKSGRITFADALSETISGAKGTAGNITGANPIQIGRGVMISSIDTNFKQGSLDATGMLTDIGINGKGFLVVTDGISKYYTRAGGLQIMDDGSVMAQGGNYFVMGRLADSTGRIPSTTALERLQLPFGRKEPARATSNVDVYCNLNNNASKIEEWLGKDELIVKPDKQDPRPAKLTDDLSMIEGNNIMLGDEIEITGTDRFGEKILTPDHKIWTFTYGKDGTTIGDFLDKINAIFNASDPINGATVSLDQLGHLRLIANRAGENDFSIFMKAKYPPNHINSTETRNSFKDFEAIPDLEINDLLAPGIMSYIAGDTIDVSLNSLPPVVPAFEFATGHETLQDLVDYINGHIEGAKAIIVRDTDNTVRIVDQKTTNTYSFTSTAGGGMNGATSTTPFEFMGTIGTPLVTTNLKNLLDVNIVDNQTIIIEGRNPDGSPVSGIFTYGATKDGTTIQDLLNKINSTFEGITATLSATGSITITDNAPGESLSSITLSSGTAIGFDITFETEVFSSNQYLDTTSTPATMTTLINSLKTTNLTPYQQGDTILVQATNMSGKTQTMVFTFGNKLLGYDGETMGDLLDRINNSNQFPGMTAQLLDGQIIFTRKGLGDGYEYTSIEISNGPLTIGKGLESNFATNAGTDNSIIRVPSFEPIVTGETGKHHSAITVYDSSGQAHRIDIYYTQDLVPGSNKWYWQVIIDEGKIVPISGNTGTVTFNDNGSLRNFSYDNGTQLRFSVIGGEEMKIHFNAGTPGAFDGTTSTDSPSTNILIEQDGYPMGTLQNINIDDSGIITGIYSNGISKALAQFALAQFTNEGGLMREGNNLFSANASSGSAMIGWAGVNNKTTLRSGYLENSNVDLTDEFASLIIAQRALEANAKVINTADTVLSTIIDRLKRS